ncbi:MAG: patatin-like phospholipase family protein [Bacteroidales bacterium]|jgi:patatin-like phospholipase/acyl hydrolase|nr:patatin-like phospholipase family protein [Bacteroidales bacterium]
MKKIKILSIDSGGIKGLIPAILLNYIEELLQQKTNNPDATLSDFFDMIAGTSTGGILACFYLIPSNNENGPKAKHFAKEAVNLYAERGKDIFKPKIETSLNKITNFFSKDKEKEKGIFKNKLTSSLNSANNLIAEEYSEVEFEKILKEEMGYAKLSETLKHCFVVSYNISTCKPVMFSTPEAKKYIHRDYYLKDISRATSAAPTYFKLAAISSLAGATQYLIDGGIFASNPALCAIVEANKYFFKDKNNFVDDMFVLSVGTGNEKEEYDYKKAQNWGVAQWAIPVMNIMMSASVEIVDYQVKQLFASANSSENYFRMEPDLCNATFELDNTSDENIKNLKDAALNYIAQNAEKIDEIVEKILVL